MQDVIETIAGMDWAVVIAGILLGMEGLKVIISIIEWTLEKFGIEFKWKNKKQKESQLLVKTAETVTKLSETMDKQIKASNIRDEKIAHLGEVIQKLERRSLASEKATVELLYNVISQKCETYIKNGGIPSDDVEPLTRLFDVYSECGGNHGLGNKVKYVLDKLQVIPEENC